MKYIKRSAFISLISCSLLAFQLSAQSAQDTLPLAVFGRFHQQAVELKWIPDNKTLMQLGLHNSYTIQRSEAGRNQFITVATVKSWNKEQWQQRIITEKDSAIKSSLEMAMDILFAPKNKEDNISLEDGIGNLKEQRSKEDLAYAVYILTALKSTAGAEALGLGFIDGNTEAGKRYTYRIVMNASSNVFAMNPGEITLTSSDQKADYQNKVEVFSGDKRISFAWTPTAQLSGYYVERSNPGSTQFKPLNKTPFYDTRSGGFEGAINGSYSDDSVVNYKWYSYRFYGLSAFGERILFAEEKGMARDFTPPEQPLVLQPKHVKAKQVNIEWTQSGDISDLKGFMVARSQKDSGTFTLLHTKILPAKSRLYSDTTFNTEGTNYYVVYALDTAGNISVSYPAYVTLIDSTPPAIPSFISGEMDSNGVVTIKLKLGIEKDLKGYRLYKSNSIEHEFSVFREEFKSDKSDTITLTGLYNDSSTLHALTPKIYYKVRALDFNFNQSDFSQVLEVKRPDIIPPVAPVIMDVLVTPMSVELQFANSNSEDVLQQEIYRRTEEDQPWQSLAILDKKAISYADTNIQIGTKYYYTMRARDEGGLYSEYANPVFGKPYDNGMRPEVTDLKVDTLNGKINLTWEYAFKLIDPVFVIYKLDVKGQLREYASTSEKYFTDSFPTKSCTYAVKVKTADGGKSKMSKQVVWGN